MPIPRRAQGERNGGVGQFGRGRAQLTARRAVKSAHALAEPVCAASAWANGGGRGGDGASTGLATGAEAKTHAQTCTDSNVTRTSAVRALPLALRRTGMTVTRRLGPSPAAAATSSRRGSPSGCTKVPGTHRYSACESVRERVRALAHVHAPALARRVSARARDWFMHMRASVRVRARPTPSDAVQCSHLPLTYGP